MATMLNVLEGEIGGRIPSLPATLENIQSVRSGTGYHGSIKRVAVNGGGGYYSNQPTPTILTGEKGERTGSAQAQRT